MPSFSGNRPTLNPVWLSCELMILKCQAHTRSVNAAHLLHQVFTYHKLFNGCQVKEKRWHEDWCWCPQYTKFSSKAKTDRPTWWARNALWLTGSSGSLLMLRLPSWLRTSSSVRSRSSLSSSADKTTSTSRSSSASLFSVSSAACLQSL